MFGIRIYVMKYVSGDENGIDHHSKFGIVLIFFGSNRKWFLRCFRNFFSLKISSYGMIHNFDQTSEPCRNIGNEWNSFFKVTRL